MNTYITIALAVLGAFALYSLLAPFAKSIGDNLESSARSAFSRRRRFALANTITATRYTDGKKTLTADAAVARHQLLKSGSSETAVALATSAAKPLAIARGAYDSGDPVAAYLLGASHGTEIGIADAAITVDVRVVPGTTAGRIRALPGTTGSYWVCGTALTAAANAGDEFEFIPCVPYLVAVP